MKHIACLFFILQISILSSKAQYFPAENDSLNYTYVLFNFPKVEGAVYYHIEIFEQLSIEKPKGKLVYSGKIKKEHCLINSGLDFGKSYNWGVTAYNGSKVKLSNSNLISFKILNSPWIGSDKYRTKLLSVNTQKCSKGFKVIDNLRTIVDQNGRPVWFLPNIVGLTDDNTRIRDLKRSPSGTFTFLTERNAIEVDLNGNLLWMAPNNGEISGDTSEFYHHDLIKLVNGNYLVLSQKYDYVPIEDVEDMSIYENQLNIIIEDVPKIKVEYGTIIEYDHNGNVVWHWSSQNYLSTSDLFHYKLPSGIPKHLTHMNGFFYDDKKGVVYISFREISRIVKINKETGEVIDSYGKKMPSGDARKGNDLFRLQHGPYLTKDNLLAVFNNDEVHEKNLISTVLLLKEPINGEDELQVKWSFSCLIDSLTNGKCLRGGYVMDLPNSNILISMGTTNRITEVTLNKEVVWDMLVEQFDLNEKKWVAFPQYRVSYFEEFYPGVTTLK